MVTVWWAALWIAVAVVEGARDQAQRGCPDVRRVRVAVRVAGPGRVVAQVVPAERDVVVELVTGQGEVGGPGRCSAEAQDVEPAAERQGAAGDPGVGVGSVPLPEAATQLAPPEATIWAEPRILPEADVAAGRVDRVDEAVDGQCVLGVVEVVADRVRAGVRVADLGRARTALGQADPVLDVVGRAMPGATVSATSIVAASMTRVVSASACPLLLHAVQTRTRINGRAGSVAAFGRRDENRRGAPRLTSGTRTFPFSAHAGRGSREHG